MLPRGWQPYQVKSHSCQGCGEYHVTQGLATFWSRVPVFGIRNILRATMNPTCRSVMSPYSANIVNRLSDMLWKWLYKKSFSCTIIPIPLKIVILSGFQRESACHGKFYHVPPLAHVLWVANRCSKPILHNLRFSTWLSSAGQRSKFERHTSL